MMKLNSLKTSLLLLGAVTALNAAAYDAVVDGKYYTLNQRNHTATITWLVHYNQQNSEAYKGDVTFPETIEVDGETYDVTAVASRAFYSCTELKSVVLPNSVTIIGASAFYGCSALQAVTLPEKLTALDASTFQNCMALEEIELPASVASLGTSTFANCVKLKALHFPDKCAFIDTGALAGCVSLADVTLPKNLIEVGYRVFSGCSALQTITIPHSLSSISISMFENCTNLRTVYLGKGVSEVSAYGFSGCSSLNDIYFASATPPGCGNASAFKGTPMVNLHVPSSSVEAFHLKNTWKDFESILPLQCSTPIVECNDGSITISTDTNLSYTPVTETYTYSVEVSDLSEGELTDEAMDEFGEMALCYNVRVIAKAQGCDDSAESLVTLCWLNRDLSLSVGDDDDPGISTGIEAQPAQRPVIVESHDGVVTVSGLNDSELVALYDLSGRQLGQTQAQGHAAVFNANVGQIVIVSVAGTSFKVRVR